MQGLTPFKMLPGSATVLVIEDEEDLRRLLIRSLERSHFNAVEASNGELGLQAARALAGSLSLVVTDINMPVMSGLEFAREFRPLYPRVPILFISGLDARVTSAATERLGGELLLKPFGPDVFIETITRVLFQSTVGHRSLA
jgi:two-component system, cell cycle sensor histidine kinase and response regulator CckA